MSELPTMTSNRPYLLRALYQWITDNNLTPYILVDAHQPGVQVPKSAIKDGKVVLNIAMRAVESLELGNTLLSFKACFSGRSQSLSVPMLAVMAIYAQETGQGMMLPADESAGAEKDLAGVPDSGQGSFAADPEAPSKASPPGKGGHLRLIK